MAAKSKSNEWTKAFIQGYCCAVANLIRGHGDSIMAEDTYKSCFYTVKKLREYEVDETDIEVLKPTIKEMIRKKKY